MISEGDLKSARFEFADSSHRVRAELSPTEPGMRLRLFDEDGRFLTDFDSPESRLCVAVDIVKVLAGVEWVRMKSPESARAA